MSRQFRCPVLGAKLPNRANKLEHRASGDFLYDRGGGHIHQGIDIGAFHDRSTSPLTEKTYQAARLAGTLDTVSVTDGVIMLVHEPEPAGQKAIPGKGYGNKIVIYHEGMDRWFLYAHCRPFGHRIQPGRPVREGEVIAQVGWSGNAGSANPHLHF